MTTKLPRIGIVADDFTGAGDAGLAFFSAGFSVEMALAARGKFPAAPAAGTRVWVLDTESRHLPGPEAARRVAAALQRLRRWKPRFIYKKIDSTLRGPVSAEVRAWLSHFNPRRPVAFAPAFPKLGRLTRNKIQFVDDEPVHRTAFARDPRAPVRASSIDTILDGAAARRFWIPDVLSDADLEKIARRIASSRGIDGKTAVGAAGLAEKLARIFSGRRRPGGHLKSSHSVENGVNPVAVVVGSRHPKSRKQLSILKKRARKSQVFYTPNIKKSAAAAMATLMRQVKLSDARRFVVTGGETAAAACRLWNLPRWRIVGAVQTGAPVCVPILEKNRQGDGNKVRIEYLVTKPGGFGEDDTLIRSLRQLEMAPACP